MATPQSGIFQEHSQYYYFLEYQITNQVNLATLKQALQQAIQVVNPAISVVVAFGHQLWQRLQPNWTPAELRDFAPLQGVHGFHIPSTQGDLLFWIHSQGCDLNFDQMRHIQQALQGLATLSLELSGFTYHDSRDLIGFVDGTANPKDDKRLAAALIADDQIGAGGSYMLTQKWVHKLGDFEKLSVPEQEKVIGRTKQTDQELRGDQMPVNSHVSRTDVKQNGKGLKIYRRSAPFGNATEQGLYFLSFACELSRFQIQLERMFGLSGDGHYDKLIEYSTPVSSAYWFAPAMEDLQAALN